MSRRMRTLFALVAVTVALAASACADATAPRPDQVPCDHNNSNTCH